MGAVSVEGTYGDILECSLNRFGMSHEFYDDGIDTHHRIVRRYTVKLLGIPLVSSKTVVAEITSEPASTQHEHSFRGKPELKYNGLQMDVVDPQFAPALERVRADLRDCGYE